MSESAPASARRPASAGPQAGPSRKCVPSTITSTEMTASAPARTTAASSPSQRTTREPGRRVSADRMASIRASSPMPVDDPGAVEVIRRDLYAYAIAGEDADAEAPHLAGHVAEHLVAVVELNPEHGVRERLDDLSLELDLLFLRQELDGPYVGGLGTLRALTELERHLRTLLEGAEAVSLDAREVHERVLAPVVGGDEPEALLVGKPLDDTSCHLPLLLTTLFRAMREVVLRHFPSRIASARLRVDAQVLPVLGRSPLARSGAAAGRGLGVGRLLRRGLVEVRVKAAPAGAVVAVVLGSAAAAAGAVAARGVDPVADAALRLLAGLVAGVLAARARVVPEERRGDERLRGLRELSAEPALDALHVLAPDLGRERAARHRAALEQRAHLDLGVGVADPHGAREAGCEADEPGVGELVRGAGLAGRRAADLRAGAGALLDVLLEDLGRLVGDAVRERLDAFHAEARRQLAPLLDVAVGEDDLADRGRAHAVAAVGDRPVRACHLERGDAQRQAAERLRRIAVEVRPDPHHHGGLLDLVGPEVEGELLVDRVVGLQRRPGQAHRAAVAVVIGLDVDRSPLRVLELQRLGHVARAVRIDALAQRGHQRHHLERRARLPVALGGEVELRVAVVRRGGHRLDVAVARVDRDDRRGRSDAAEVGRDRGARLALQLEIDRRVDLHAAAADGAGAVLLDQLVLDVVEDVALAPARVVGRRLDAERPGDRL